MRILFVDDEDVVRKSVSRFLSYNGFEVLTTGTLAETTQLVDGDVAFDAIILDYKLPDGNGLDLCKELRRRSLDVPIILYTVDEDPALEEAALMNGVDDVAHKARSRNILVARLFRLLKMSPDASALRLERKTRVLHTERLHVVLTPLEFLIVDLLLEADEYVDMGALVEGAYGEANSAETRAKLGVHLSNLRRKLQSIDYSIHTTRGKGVRLVRMDGGGVGVPPGG